MSTRTCQKSSGMDNLACDSAPKDFVRWFDPWCPTSTKKGVQKKQSCIKTQVVTESEFLSLDCFVFSLFPEFQIHPHFDLWCDSSFRLSRHLPTKFCSQVSKSDQMSTITSNFKSIVDETCICFASVCFKLDIA